MNNLKFRAYIKSIKKVIDVLTLDFKNKTVTLDIDTDKVESSSDFWWSETVLNFEDVEIMQSTGLFDKNGKEIFEGDIIATTKNKYEIIQGVTGLWKAVNKQSEHYLCLDDICLTAVIGNIYENKELNNEN